MLTALQIVATRAGVRELAQWAAKEMQCYDEDDELPAHRIWKLSIVATLHNPVQGVVHNTHVGDGAVAEELRERVTTFHCRQSVGDIESTLAGSNGGTFGTNQPNLAMLINQGPTGVRSRLRPKHAWPSLSIWNRGTTPAVCNPRWGT